MQLIFVVETNKTSQSDYIYIIETLKEFYNTLGHKLTPVFMNGKGNYNKKQDEININIAKYKGKSKVFICHDIDNTNDPAYIINKGIVSYAKENDYEVIWFYEDIEQVYLGNSVSKNLKTVCAQRFARQEKIKKIDINSLTREKIETKGTSNILVIIDKYLPRISDSKKV